MEYLLSLASNNFFIIIFSLIINIILNIMQIFIKILLKKIKNFKLMQI